MKFFVNLGKVIGFTVISAFCAVLVWGVLYLVIPPVKDWTDNTIFYPPVVEEESTTDEEETIAPQAKFNASNNTITIEV